MCASPVLTGERGETHRAADLFFGEVSECAALGRLRGDVAHRARRICLKQTMNEATKRLIARLIHLVLSVPIIGYCYSPFEQLPGYAGVVRYVAIPGLVVTGLWMWIGYRLRRARTLQP